MKRLVSIMAVIGLFFLFCDHMSAYMIDKASISWSFSIADKATPPLAFSISDTQIIPTDSGYLITVTFSPIPGPKSVTLTIPSTQSSLLSSPPLPSSEGGEDITEEMEDIP